MSLFFTSVVAIVVVLGLMIFVHEWGHFLMARLVGVRVEVFSLGFGPRLWGLRRGPTDYRISALPLGGYVRMAGDNPAEPRSGAADEFLSKPRWQRALIVLAGPVMNILFATLLVSGLLLVGGAEPVFLQQQPVVAGVLAGSAAAAAGVQPGDRIVAVANHRVATWDDVYWNLLFVQPGEQIALQVLRQGRPQTLAITVPSQGADEPALVGYPNQPTLVDSIGPGTPAEQAGLRPGDRVIAVNGQTVHSPAQLAATIAASGGRPLRLLVDRAGQSVELLASPRFGDPGDGRPRWYIGARFRTAIVYRRHSLAEAVRGGLRYTVRLTTEVLQAVLALAERRASVKQLVGPVGLAKQSGEAARRGWADLVNLMAFVSLNLGILNLLPIPILDGGHLAMLSIEAVLRRDLGVAVKERIAQAGFAFLLLLFLVVMYNDVVRLFAGQH